MTNIIKQLLTSLETCLRTSEAFYKKIFDWKPYNLAFKLKIVAEAEAVKNNSEIAREYGTSESMFRCWSKDQANLFNGELIGEHILSSIKGKGKGTRYLTSEVPLLSREYSPRVFRAKKSK